MSAERAVRAQRRRRHAFWCCSLFASACAFAAPALAALPPGYVLSLGIYRPATNHVYAYSDLTTKAFALDGPYGSSGDIPVAADFDGNGVDDLAVYHGGVWNIDTNQDYTADKVMNFGGAAGDVPLAADFDGDGTADLVIYRAGTWFIRSSLTGQTSQRSLGTAGDMPVVGDFDGDGIPDIAVYRAGTWLIQTHSASGADSVDHFGGLAHDLPCTADWDHDGRADLCIYRDGIWRFKSLAGPDPIGVYALGGPGDIPLAGGVFDSAAIYVKAGAPTPRDGTAAHPFDTIGKAFDAATDGAVIRVGAGNYSETLSLYSPTIQYAPGKFGKNNLKVFGVSRRAVIVSSPSGDALTLWGSTGHMLENFTIGAPSTRGVVLIGGPQSVSPSLPGSSISLAFDKIFETSSYGVLITGSSHADIRGSQINRSKTKSGLGLQSGATSANLIDNEFAQNGYTLASGLDGNGIEAQSSPTVAIVGNQIHDNNRFGIIGINDSRLDIEYNTISANRLNGIIVGGGSPNDTTTTKVIGNWISGNGVDLQNGGQGYNGMEIFITSIGVHTVTGNTFVGNSQNGLFAGAGTVTATNNLFENNANGIFLFVEDASSANTQATIMGNVFIDNLHDGVYAERPAGTTTRTLKATVGGTQAGASNTFTGQGYHGISCLNNNSQLTCPHLGNTFSGNVDDIESTCPATCVK